MNELKHIDLALVRENPDSLRKVNKDTADYQQLVDSIRNIGLQMPITVIEAVEIVGEKPANIYRVVDGLHRFTASVDAGLETIPAHIVKMDQKEVMMAQIIGNAMRVETRPVEYSRHLVKILDLDPLMTRADMASSLSKSVTWIDERLDLVNLADSVAELVDNGDIKLSNAYALAKLPNDEQSNYLIQAQTAAPAEFQALIKARLKELRDARREGREPTVDYNAPVHLRKRVEIEEVMNDLRLIEKLAVGAKNAPEGFIYALKWMLHLDDATVEAGRADWEAKQRAAAEAKEKRASERLEREAKKAVEKAEEARKKLEEISN